MQLQLNTDPVVCANFAQNLCQATSSFIQNSFIDETKKIDFPKKITQAAALDVLTQPDLDKLAYYIPDRKLAYHIPASPRNDILAKKVFTQLNQEEFMKMDCQTIKKLHRQVMLLVHPDKPGALGSSIAHQAAVNLNNAREALNC